MKRFLIYVAGLLLVGIVALAVNEITVRYLMAASGASEAYKMQRLYGTDFEDEIALIGSSRAVACYVPSMIGNRVFDYGLNGSRQNETVEHLEYILAHKQNTKAIIVNLDPWGITEGPKCGDYRFVAGRTDIDWADRCWGVRCFGLLKGALADWINSVRTGGGQNLGGKRIDNGATLPRIERSQKEWAAICDKIVLPEVAIAPGVLDKYIALLSEQHVPVIFVVAPICQEWWNKLQHKERLTALIDQLSQLPATFVLDFSVSLLDRLDYTCFQDASHLNEKGAIIFSQVLKPRIDSILGIGR